MRRWIPVGVITCCVGLALVIAGWPDRHQDEPLAVSSVSTTAAPAATISSPPSTETASTTPPAGPTRAPASVHVIAFNASSVPGSAGRVSTRLKTQGYAVGPAGPDKKPARDTTAVVYRPGFDAEAKALAVALGLDPSAAQASTESAPGGWGTADVAVIVGNDVARA